MAKRGGKFPTPHALNGIRDSCRSFVIWHDPFFIYCYYFPRKATQTHKVVLPISWSALLMFQHALVTLESLIHLELIISQSKDRDLVSAFYMGISLFVSPSMYAFAPLLSVLCEFVSGSSILIYWSMILFVCISCSFCHYGSGV
jgi:hypothetical protein